MPVAKCLALFVRKKVMQIMQKEMFGLVSVSLEMKNNAFLCEKHGFASVRDTFAFVRGTATPLGQNQIHFLALF